ncbi:DNA-processing protein DprA [Pararhodospirillum photometricum]|uniref:Smf/DprA SLOG domain-containing protein n=1 Tax=Pararhodospirillum photometricum DSM 122 TaxID=1150469 RepID=H6SJV2_PARPM|nr:DNA-processing protein DprA [Pararhodospirillum photometricum]CCG08267.1 Putative uncharacterized protein [Pararhodospirillum photometricum DSM 122]
MLAGFLDRTISVARLRALLGRGAALGLALEKWQRAGLWVMTRSDPDYPERLKRRLRAESPAVLFGCGSKALLNTGGIAVVGARDAQDEDLAAAETLGAQAAAQGYTLVSGGARGVDQRAMLGALERRGTAVGVLADSLLRSATSSLYRNALLAGALVLVSPFNPEAGFHVGTAMARNRYIYCLADAAVVISSTREKGGTWSGAIENIQAKWVPLWVRPSTDPQSGNVDLAERGAPWLPDPLPALSSLLEKPAVPLVPAAFPQPAPRDEPQGEAEATRQGPPSTVPAPVSPAPPAPSDLEFYPLFLRRLLDLTAAAPLTLEDLAARLDLERAQVAAWLKRAEGEGKVARRIRPVRYQASVPGQGQASLF